jgi:hypothetical protein
MKAVIFFLSIFISVNAYSVAHVSLFTVENVRVDKSGKGYVKFSVRLAGSPASCSNHLNHLAFDTNTPGGQAIMSLALTAQSTGKKIYARGTNTCDIYSVVESWDWGYIVN